MSWASAQTVRLGTPARAVTFSLTKHEAKPRFFILRHDDKLALGDMNSSGVGNRIEPWRPGDRKAEGTIIVTVVYPIQLEPG